MRIPNSWKEVTVNQFQQHEAVTEDDLETEGVEIERFQILTGATDEELDEMDFTGFAKANAGLSWMARKPTTYKKQVGEFRFKGFGLLELGEFIDLERLCERGYDKNLTAILTTLYRKTDIGDWGETLIEPYSVIEHETRRKEFLEMSMADVYGVVPAYLKFRNDFMARYAEEFGLEDDPEDDDEDDEPKTAQDKLKAKWSWELFLFNLAGKDLTKIEQVTQLPVAMAFRFAKMKRELKID